MAFDIVVLKEQMVCKWHSALGRMMVLKAGEGD